MTLTRRSIPTIVFLSLLFVPPLHAVGTCQLSILRHQRKDVATVLHLEEAWNIAYLRGDTDLERCLLVPGFTEIMRDGKILGLADELELAERNRGKSLPIPGSPKITVLLHGNVTVAYGKTVTVDSAGKMLTKLYSDSYVWEHGVWHVFFAQQTQSN